MQITEVIVLMLGGPSWMLSQLRLDIVMLVIVRRLKLILPIFLATIWISLSEFVRNELLLKSFWTEHYYSLSLVFPSRPINGAVWGLWSLCFAVAIYVIATKFSLLQTTFLAWFMAFVMMWVVIGNLNVLPPLLLLYAIPLSLLEAFIATWIIKKFQTRQ